ncbi:cAMP-binding domain of CRP or a regulatory subunit of cAMP-dependent protein kinases [Chryseobacterium soldanellicola]|uniref:cAMP-binding domain of CRP or a regulatory subunit of cAMP-dependent protein kinases n=1 Tax=Chryseobacterium soldanellicola TaxID=311333 RepID=A0A1H1GHZ7_9FLAO|nr:Crp/Fnr family transcriptional regulator [Chryseobacterium soldanellicola]SDR12518.1 cAMP-binding domain of CRP or a regulatory subunit of cAMP-dependent protein kinases [Chryseobacterium soldanellicola]
MFNSLYKNISRYIQLSETEFEDFSEYFKLHSYKKKDIILHEGEYCLFEGFVLNGCFKVFFLNEQGTEQTLYFAVDNWWITDLDSLINNVPSVLNIEALEDSQVLMISKKDKELLYGVMPLVEKLFRIMNQQSSIALQRRILSLMNKTADKRYLEFLEKYPSLEQRLTQQQVASYLGISHEFLSKIRKKTTLGK